MLKQISTQIYWNRPFRQWNSSTNCCVLKKSPSFLRTYKLTFKVNAAILLCIPHFPPGLTPGEKHIHYTYMVPYSLQLFIDLVHAFLFAIGEKTQRLFICKNGIQKSCGLVSLILLWDFAVVAKTFCSVHQIWRKLIPSSF